MFRPTISPLLIFALLITFLFTITSTMATTTTPETFALDPKTLVNARCGDSGTKLGTPTYGNEGIVFTTCVERDIRAPVEKVFDALLEFSEYQNWDGFVVDVKSRCGSAPPAGVVPNGYKMTFTTKGLIPGVNTTSNEIVTITEKDVLGDGSGRVAMNGWRFEGIGQRAEHVNLLVELGEGVTRYVSWESHYGVVAHGTRLLEGRLGRAFERQGGDLKRLVER